MWIFCTLFEGWGYSWKFDSFVLAAPHPIADVDFVTHYEVDPRRISAEGVWVSEGKWQGKNTLPKAICVSKLSQTQNRTINKRM
jgi:hypothetical protein